MAVIRRLVSVPAAGNVDVNLAPFDRFGGRGGRVAVAAVAEVAAEAHDKTMTVLVGSDILCDELQLGGPTTALAGVTTEIPRVTGFGAPADPITVRLFNGAVGAELVSVEVSVENA